MNQKEDLEALVEQLSEAVAVDEYAELAVDLGLVYAHLNRDWHSRIKFFIGPRSAVLSRTKKPPNKRSKWNP